MSQQKVLQKILEKVFINKKFTQNKTSRTLKIDVFKIPDIKNIGNLFSKYKLLFLDHINSSCDRSQILILWFSIPRASLPPSPSLWNLSPATWNRYLQHNLHHVLYWFPYFVLSLSTTRHYRYWIYRTIWQAKPIKFIINMYTDHNNGSNTLPIK